MTPALLSSEKRKLCHAASPFAGLRRGVYGNQDSPSSNCCSSPIVFATSAPCTDMRSPRDPQAGVPHLMHAMPRPMRNPIEAGCRSTRSSTVMPASMAIFFMR